MLLHYLTVLVTAMLPIAELRGAIPLGIAAFDLHPIVTYILAVVGNMIPVFAILAFLDSYALKIAEKYKPLGELLHWVFERTRKKFYNNHKKFGSLALILFVAVPFPITGAWTGSVAAWLFGIPYKKAVSYITIGVLISGVIVTLATMGIITIATS